MVKHMCNTSNKRTTGPSHPRSLPKSLATSPTGLSQGQDAQGRFLRELLARQQRISSQKDVSYQELLDENTALLHDNRRLAGALQIVFETLDVTDVPRLFDRLLEEINIMMDADAALMFLAEEDGFYLRACTNERVEDQIAHFFSHQDPLPMAIVRTGRTLRLHLEDLETQELRQGHVRSRRLISEDLAAPLELPLHKVPPFTSCLALPVWFSGSLIALIKVGWFGKHTLSPCDVELLDAIASYLSLQMVGVLRTLRSEHEEQLQQLASKLRERLLQVHAERQHAFQEDLCSVAFEVLHTASQELNAYDLLLEPLDEDHIIVSLASLLSLGREEIPQTLELRFSMSELEEHVKEDRVVPLYTFKPLHVMCQQLHLMGAPSEGVVLNMGVISGKRRWVIFVRFEDEEPFDDLKIEFLQQLLDEISHLSQGDTIREQNKRIAQALQVGMQNELQHVKGLRTEAVYSSATASALVGGDFYDLIRLPDHKACVIMGDVSGKGVEAASISAAVKTAIAAYAWEGLKPAKMVGLLNNFLLGFSRVETFATLFVGVIDVEHQSLVYCSAGHPPAHMIRAKTGELDLLDKQSGVVGAFPEMEYVDGSVDFGTNDILVLYTDGTTEARSTAGEFFGEEGLADMLMAESGAQKDFEGFSQRLLDTLDAFTGRNLTDDVAIVAVQME